MYKVYNYLNSHPDAMGVIEILGTQYRITRVYNLRNSEKPEYRESVNLSFGVWIIQPTRNVFLRVELV